MTIYGLIPARSGSKRVPGKNTRELAGHPLLAYTIAAARDSGVFDKVWLSSDSFDTVRLARRYGIHAYLAGINVHLDTSTDYEWICGLFDIDNPPDAFVILRPTSPFRLGSTIARAWAEFQASGADSLRAVKPVKEHPGKMWVNRHGRLLPLLPFAGESQPWHSMPTQELPAVYVQTSALEFAWTERTIARGTIAGEAVAPFEMSSLEALSIDTEDDWLKAEHLMASPLIARPDPSRYRLAHGRPALAGESSDGPRAASAVQSRS